MASSQLIATQTFLFSCIFVELTSIVYLLFQMFHARSPLRKSYFIIAVFGYCIDIIAKLNEAINEYSILSSTFQWHVYYFFGVWHFTLTLNRFTSIVYWQQYNVIWATKMAACWCFGIFLYPIVIDVPFILFEATQFSCLRNMYTAPCRAFYGNLGIRQSVSNVLTSLGSIVLSTITIVRIKKTSTPKIATKLMIQCCISTLLFFVFTIFLIIYSVAWKCNNAALVYTSATVLNISLYFHQSFGVCWLLVICRSMIKTNSKDVVVSSVAPTPTPVRDRIFSFSHRLN